MTRKEWRAPKGLNIIILNVRDNIALYNEIPVASDEVNRIVV